MGLIILSCSSDDNSNNENINGFEIEGSFFETSIAYLYDENISNDSPNDLAIILSNKSLLNGDINSGLTFFYLDFNGVDFQVGTKEVLDYRILENATLSNDLVQGGNTILDDDDNSGFNATLSKLIINSISSTNIDFEFSFTREDGEVISGNYSGTYTDIDN